MKVKYKPMYQDFFKKDTESMRVRFEISIDAVADAEILAELEKHPNKSEYVRQLVREDIKKRGS